MARTTLSQEEQELLDSYEQDEWVSIKSPQATSKYQAIARATLQAETQVNISISERDFQLLQEKAMMEGIPYQTLMSSVLHKYATGRFAERSDA
jgi:predicted DNA binding CopG/RHH family protein